MRHSAPLVYLNRRGGLAGGLGIAVGEPSPAPSSATGYTEAALQAKLAELARVRADADAIQAQITAIKTGKPAQPQIEPARAPAPAPAIPGGTVNVPVLGEVPTLVLVAGAIGAVTFWAKARR